MTVGPDDYNRTHEHTRSRTGSGSRGRRRPQPCRPARVHPHGPLTEDAAAARQLALAARWADLHPPESIHTAATFSYGGGLGREHEEPIAGPGCPLVAEFCIAELGTVLGISTVAAKKLIGHALELRHRLPRLWAQVHAGAGSRPGGPAPSPKPPSTPPPPSPVKPPPGSTPRSPPSQVGSGPRSSTGSSPRPSSATTSTHVDPAADPEDGWLHVDPRHVTVDTDDVHFAGTMHVEADIDIADALDLDRALAHSAATQKALGSELSLNARRAKALGDLARTQTALDLFEQGHTGSTTAGDPDGLPVARELVLHAHFAVESMADGQTVFGPTGRLEEGQRLVLLDQLRSWCGDSRTKITIKPVIDLNQTKSAPGYTIPDRIREHVILRDGTCVFPWCTRPARRCDIDHIQAYDHTTDAEHQPQPGPTHTDNLAALCRFHHRLKTHTAWRYEMVEPGAYVWTSPHGHQFRRDRTGSTALDPPEVPQPRRP